MGELRFDGRTAIVTGAGGNPSLGRAHALLLARRGANVVVNDIGHDPQTPGYSDSASAAKVVEEIRALGGKAVADSHSVATEEGARAIIQTALEAFGEVDILINNAGTCIMASIEEMASSDFQRVIDINLMGPIWTCRAAWPHMRAKGYGRIVNIASGAMTGIALRTAYSASKGGLFSFTRALATEGENLGIKVNTVNPVAFTRMVVATHQETSSWYKYSKDNLPPELVSPIVAFLAHENCPVTGECVESVGKRVSRVYIAQTQGLTDADLSIETIERRWGEVFAGTAESILSNHTFNPRADEIKRHPPAKSP